MWNKFKTGQFGSPAPARGIGTPMNASIQQLGRATYFGPEAYGTTIPQEQAAGMRTGGYLPPEELVSINPVSGARVITGGNLPPQVVPNKKGSEWFARFLAGMRKERGG